MTDKERVNDAIFRAISGPGRLSDDALKAVGA